MEDYAGGSRPNADGGIGPSAEFTPIAAGEWFLISDSRLDGLFKSRAGIRRFGRAGCN